MLWNEEMYRKTYGIKTMRSFYAQGRVRKLAASLHAPRAASSGEGHSPTQLHTPMQVKYATGAVHWRVHGHVRQVVALLYAFVARVVEKCISLTRLDKLRLVIVIYFKLIIYLDRRSILLYIVYQISK